ncbi:Tubulin beta-2 chain [Cerrena zonata]|uniref:Tubulin beta-2 chain n=1 Tax=Cerrena zonata TaxID=2478898 RepID=A0AAW0GBR3_9APHY
MLSTFSVLPSPKVSETVVEPYNSLLSIHQLVEASDMTMLIDNEALYDITVRTLKTPSPAFEDLNVVRTLISCFASDVWYKHQSPIPWTAQWRYEEACTQPRSVPSTSFLMPSYAPYFDPKARAFIRMGVNELTQSLFDRRNLLVACDPRHGRYLTAAMIFRGSVSSNEAEQSVFDLQRKNSSQFVEWIPDNVSVTLCTVPPVGQNQSATCLANSTSVQELFKRNLSQFATMYKRRAFLHWYTGEGMDTMEFSEAESNARDLISEYQQYQEATTEEEEEFEAEGEYEEEPAAGYAGRGCLLCSRRGRSCI